MEETHEETQTCKKCNKVFYTKEKDHVFVAIGYTDPTTKTFISTKEWCLLCCIKLERGEI
jgi:hypothetical protein